MLAPADLGGGKYGGEVLAANQKASACMRTQSLAEGEKLGSAKVGEANPALGNWYTWKACSVAATLPKIL